MQSLGRGDGALDGTALVGREHEVRALGRLLEDVRHSHDTQIAVIAGEAGMGKTTLVDAVLARTGDATVVRGPCLNLGAARPPYTPIVQALRPLLRDPTAHGIDLDEPARAMLSRLVPELGAVGASSVRVGGLDTEMTQLYGHVLGVLEQAAAHAGLLVLCVEDIHWCDPATRDLLAFLADNLIGAPAAVVVTVRAEEVDRRHPARSLLTTLTRSSRATRIDLGPLAQDAVRDLVRSVLRTDRVDGVLERIVARSEGNPMFATELAERGGQVSDDLIDLLLARVDELTPSARRVLRVLAAAGEDLLHTTLEAVSGLGGPELVEAVRETIDQRLVVVTTSGGHQFRHSLVAEAVTGTLVPGEAVALHTSLAEFLIADGGLTGGHAARLARHHRAAGRVADELEAAHAAAEQAAAALAIPDAQAHLERVAELWPSVPDATARTGTDLAEVYATAAAHAIARLEHGPGLVLAAQALDHLDFASQPERAAMVHTWIAQAKDDDGPAALAALRTAEALLPAGDSAVRARVEGGLAITLMLEGALDEALVMAGRAAATAQRVGAGADEGNALTTLATVRGLQGDIDDAMALFDQARPILHASNRIDLVLRCVYNRSAILMLVGRRREVLPVVGEGVALASQHGLDLGYGNAMLTTRAEALMELGRSEEARAVAVEVLRTARNASVRGEVLGIAIRVHLQLGEVETARRHLAELRQIATTQPARLILLAALRAEVALAGGDTQEAAAALTEAMADLDAVPAHVPLIIAMWARTVRAAGDLGLVPRPPGASEATPPVLAITAEVEATVVELSGVGDPITAWTAARDAYAALETRCDEARCSLVLAELALRARDKAAARDHLSHARSLADRGGAIALVDACDALALRGGLVDAESDDRFRLTPREQEVLRLVADGLTNGQIGTRLFISTKTASVHVSNILAKFGATTRTEAATAAHRHGLL